jgi:hypothetical protein
MQLLPGQEHRLTVALATSKGSWGPPPDERGVLAQWLLLALLVPSRAMKVRGSVAACAWAWVDRSHRWLI